MDRKEQLELQKEGIDKAIEHNRHIVNLVYPIVLGSGGYVFAHLDLVLAHEFGDPALLYAVLVFFIATGAVIRFLANTTRLLMKRDALNEEEQELWRK